MKHEEIELERLHSYIQIYICQYVNTVTKNISFVAINVYLRGED